MSALSGVQVLVTAGPTYEPIDPVRFIGNFSTGKMGAAIAEAFSREGAEVHLVMGPSHVYTSPGIHRTDVTSASQMYEASAKIFPECKIAIMAAAVADFRPKVYANTKIKKIEGEDEFTL